MCDHFRTLFIKGLKIFLFILEIQLQMKRGTFPFEYIINKYVATVSTTPLSTEGRGSERNE